MKVNDVVRVVMPVIQGKVLDVKFDENTGEKKAFVSWVDGDDNHERWFLVKELEVVE